MMRSGDDGDDEGEGDDDRCDGTVRKVRRRRVTVMMTDDDDDGVSGDRTGR